MALRRLSITIVLLLAGCGEFRPIGPEYHYTRHKVQPSETLYSIAFRFGYDYREVAAWNNILPPYTIRVGDELLILDPPAGEEEDAPDEAPTPAPKPAPGSAVPKGGGPKAVAAAKPIKKPTPKPRPAAVTPLLPSHGPAIKWAWPTQGKLTARFAARAGRKGIDVAGKSGQTIKAAADGEVVYSGNGLIGYGNLVIIKHDDAYLSAYGHNRKLLVKEGDKVRVGQAIGEMGQHPKSGSILHFEVRRNGKPVDPLLYLPNQTS